MNNLPLTTNKILIVDDTPENLSLLIETLEPHGYQIFIADSGEKALKIAPKIEPDLILLDIMMPGIDGYETCRRLKENPDLKDVPVIFLSALDSIEDKIKAFEMGGVDYISKPFNHLEVLSRVKTHLKIGSLIKNLGELVKKSFHEIYTPMSVIDTAVQMQEIEYGPTEYLDAIKAASKTLHVVYEDIYYSLQREVSAYEPTKIDLVAFVKDRLKYFDILAKTKSMQFKLHLDGEGARYIYINESELQRVVDNVLSNAIKYGKEASWIDVCIKETKSSICLSVTDFGKEIKDREKIFSKLYRESIDEVGFGIGLDIVRVICKKYDIDVHVKSQDGKTTFRFCFKKMRDAGSTA